MQMQELPSDIELFKEAVTQYLTTVKQATTKDVAENIKGMRNRAVVENYLLRLFMRDELLMARKGRIKVWSLNHVRINSKTKPTATLRIPIYDDTGKNVKNFWISLYNSSTLGDYIYINETVFDSKRWVPKGAVILPIDMVADYVFNLLKVAVRSEQFKEQHPQLSSRIVDFIKGLSLDVGLTVT